MHGMDDRSSLTPEDFRLIREFVADRFGLLIDESKMNLLSREIGPRLKKLRLTTVSDYYALLKYGPSSSEQSSFISLLTNNETTFFREELQLKAFADKILSALKEKKNSRNSRQIRILSAGCSTGEEVYTLAMLLLDSGQFVWEWDVKVFGMDVDREALAKAERGIYSGRAFQTTPSHYMDRYFRKNGGGYEVRDIVRKITSFTQGNLLEFGASVPEKMFDVIFCRNVLIYFSDDTVRRVVESFAPFLEKHGFLFLGHSESLARITDRYLPLRYPGTIIYGIKD